MFESVDLPLPATPDDAIGEVFTEPVRIDQHLFWIRRPADPDRVLDHPATHAAFARDEYMPYWCDLWPAARILAKVLMREEWPQGWTVLELGCGLGLPGIAALTKGLHVTFSDYDRTALRFAAENALLNGCAASSFELLPFDWRHPPNRRFDLILASDLIYEERNVPVVVDVLKQMLDPKGVCLLTDQDRKPAGMLRTALMAAGFMFTTEMLRAGQPASPGQPAPMRVKGTLYRIRFSETCQPARDAIPQTAASAPNINRI